MSSLGFRGQENHIAYMRCICQCREGLQVAVLCRSMLQVLGLCHRIEAACLSLQSTTPVPQA